MQAPCLQLRPLATAIYPLPTIPEDARIDVNPPGEIQLSALTLSKHETRPVEVFQYFDGVKRSPKRGLEDCSVYS